MITAVNAVHRAFEPDGRLYRLSYTLFAHPCTLCPGRTGYDLEVMLTDRLSGSTERCLISDVTTDEARARQLLQQLADGLVTPVTARDVLEDLLVSL